MKKYILAFLATFAIFVINVNAAPIIKAVDKEKAQTNYAVAESATALNWITTTLTDVNQKSTTIIPAAPNVTTEQAIVQKDQANTFNYTDANKKDAGKDQTMDATTKATTWKDKDRGNFDVKNIMVSTTDGAKEQPVFVQLK